MNDDHYETHRVAYERTDWVCHNSGAKNPDILRDVPYMVGQRNNWNYCPICGCEL